MDYDKLLPGDGTTARSFKKVLRGNNPRDKLELTFKAPPGQDFVVLYLGAVRAGERPDVDAMLAQLGYVPKE